MSGRLRQVGSTWPRLPSSVQILEMSSVRAAAPELLFLTAHIASRTLRPSFARARLLGPFHRSCRACPFHPSHLICGSEALADDMQSHCVVCASTVCAVSCTCKVAPIGDGLRAALSAGGHAGAISRSRSGFRAARSKNDILNSSIALINCCAIQY